MSAAAQGDTKSRLLEAATELFSRDGFEGASTRAIGSLAGVNIATLAYHFGSKEGLYEAVLAQIYEEILALEPPRKLAPTPPAEFGRRWPSFWALRGNASSWSASCSCTSSCTGASQPRSEIRSTPACSAGLLSGWGRSTFRFCVHTA